MGLSEGRIEAAIAVTDMERAIEFYEGQLGLEGSGEAKPDGGRDYSCGGGTSLHIFPSPGVRPTGATIASFIVDDVERTVDDLLARGVTFLTYSDGPFATDEKGLVHVNGYVGAWLKDPDGNVLGIGSG